MALRQFLPWNRDKEVTVVSPTTEIRIPWLGWLSMMALTPLFAVFCWTVGFAFWYYDAIQSGYRWRYWIMRMFDPWFYDNGGFVLVIISVLICWIAGTFITIYRFWTETGAKQWDARDGAWYFGKTVAPTERHGP